MKTCPHESLYTNVHNSIIIHSKQSNKQLKGQSTMNVKIKSGWKRLLRVPWRARRSNQSILKESVLNIHWKVWYWSWNSSTLATWCKELTHWKRPWCWERLKAGGEGDDRGWDGWMASPTQWTWVWASSKSWWWTGKPGMLQSMGSQRVRQDWATELKWTGPLKTVYSRNEEILKILWRPFNY